MTEVALKRTPLFEAHQKLGAKLVGFAGWEMPVRYEGTLAEHQAVREAAGLFDVSHMGEIFVTGENSLEALQRLIPNDASRLKEGEVLYTPLCRESGGVVDDVLLHRIALDEWFFCVNASNIEKDFEWIQSKIGDRAEVLNESPNWVQLALQGPRSVAILQPLTPFLLNNLYYYQFAQCRVTDVPVILARTGYTGEDGFELYIPKEKGLSLWNALLEAGQKEGLKPVGLAARDTLRLEMGYPLYGHELSDTITPLEAGVGWTIAWDKGAFIGKEALEKQKAEGIARKLIGLETTEGIPREGYSILMGEQKVGEITSGTHSPSLKKGIALGWARSEFLKGEKEFSIGIRNRPVAAKRVKPPFWPTHVRKKT
ncbi:MAG: glycine cleavage system aminomethyltransferase GcvT [Deltaproteobacteria bacterium]|nr:glycine cleavage system aminomethyltransferase GcvT [Deltaproteobacteria bacterium]